MPVTSALYKTMKLVISVVLGLLITTIACASEKSYEVTITSVEPYIIGKQIWESTQMVVGDLQGKYLGKVLVGDIQGKLSLYILACNEFDTDATVAISASLTDSDGGRLWDSESSTFTFKANKCPNGIGFVVYGDDYKKGLPVSELSLPIHLMIKYNER